MLPWIFHESLTIIIEFVNIIAVIAVANSSGHFFYREVGEGHIKTYEYDSSKNQIPLCVLFVLSKIVFQGIIFCFEYLILNTKFNSFSHLCFHGNMVFVQDLSRSNIHE